MKIDNDVMAVLEQAQATNSGITLTGQLDRKTYERVNKVLEAAGFKWQRSTKAHTHPDAAPADALDQLLSTGEVATASEFGFFETTGLALERLIELAQIESGDAVLDPSCGTGNIISAADKEGGVMFGFEIQQKNIDALYARGMTPEGGVTCCDFLSVAPVAAYDRVVMNPPFAKQVDLDHVLHAVKFLKPGGRLVSIMASGVRHRQNAKTQRFHDAISAMSPAWEDLPADSFKASGTSVNTCILTLTA